LKEVKIKRNSEDLDDEIPVEAMANKYSLLRLVLPDQLLKIKRSAFIGCKNLTGSLIIPEGVTYIGASAFDKCRALTGTLVLPTTLEYIDGGDFAGNMGAFGGCGFTCELKLPEKLKHLGEWSFRECNGLYGTLTLPDKLEFIGLGAFHECKNLS